MKKGVILRKKTQDKVEIVVFPSENVLQMKEGEKTGWY